MDFPILFEDICNLNNMKHSFTITPSRKTALDLIANAISYKRVVIFEGVAGIGKTKIIEVASKAINNNKKSDNLIIISFNKNMTINELMGRYIPRI